MATPRDSIGHRSETVRRVNLSAIVRELHVHGPLSRSDLVGRTGLTRSGIRALLAELVTGGLVDERPSRSAGTPGRPSPMVRPRDDRAVVLALEVNIDSLAMAVVGYGGAVQRLVRVERPRTHVTVDAIVDDLVDLVRPVVGQLRHGDALLGVGVAVAGTVRRTDGVVRQAPNLGWRDAPLGDRMRAALDLDVPISVANEADLGGLAEHRRGAAVGFDDVVYVMGEVGVGGNVIIRGEPLIGVAGYAGEVGHMPVNPQGRTCGCGSFGCWETEVGERAMLMRAGRPIDGGRDAVIRLIEDAAAGDVDALAAVAEVASWLGIGLAVLVNVFNPRLVVLGGIFERMHAGSGPSIEEAMRRRALSPSAELVRVVPGRLGQDAPLLGAAELAFEPMLADPAAWLGPRAVALATA